MSDGTQPFAASLYDSWLRLLPSVFTAITPAGMMSGRSFEGVGGTHGEVHPIVKSMLDATGIAQQAFNSLYLGYAQALGANGSGALVENWLRAGPAEIKRVLEQFTQLLGAPQLAMIVDPRVPNPVMTGLEHTFTALGDAIGFAPTRVLRDAYRDLLAAMADQRAAQLKYVAFLGGTWGKVNERLVARLREMGERGESVDSLLGLVRLWASVADDVLHDAMQSEEGVAYTAAYIRGATRSRQQRNRMIEILSELCNVPTRAEVDDLHREVHALKKQLRRSARGVQPAPATPRKKHRTSTRKGEDR